VTFLELESVQDLVRDVGFLEYAGAAILEICGNQGQPALDGVGSLDINIGPESYAGVTVMRGHQGKRVQGARKLYDDPFEKQGPGVGSRPPPFRLEYGSPPTSGFGVDPGDGG